MNFKVNADYESVLYHSKEIPVINHTLEFLYFFLENDTLFTHKKYDLAYLEHVEEITGTKPKITSSGTFRNWWGELNDLPLERELNSKVLSASLSHHSQVITDLSLLQLTPQTKYLAKDPFGMSGMGFYTFEEKDAHLESLLTKSKCLIVEPLFNRTNDFSHYFLDDELICYENVVDQKFQYKGTLFSHNKIPKVESLRFFSDIPEAHWTLFHEELNAIINHYKNLGAKKGFSIDSFVYDHTHIRALSEVNYRKTMGLVAWKLTQKFSRDLPWSLFILGKGRKNFLETKKITSQIKDCFLLSPGDTRFEMFLLNAENEGEGRKKFSELKRLLPDCEFAVQL